MTTAGNFCHTIDQLKAYVTIALTKGLEHKLGLRDSVDASQMKFLRR